MTKKFEEGFVGNIRNRSFRENWLWKSAKKIKDRIFLLFRPIKVPKKWTKHDNTESRSWLTFKSINPSIKTSRSFWEECLEYRDEPKLTMFWPEKTNPDSKSVVETIYVIGVSEVIASIEKLLNNSLVEKGNTKSWKNWVGMSNHIKTISNFWHFFVLRIVLHGN